MVLTTYSIESILFCLLPSKLCISSLTCTAFLKLHGANAKEHPVFRELTRVKQYFDKIKSTELEKQGPNLRVDQAAAGRIIKHALVRTLQIPSILTETGAKVPVVNAVVRRLTFL